MVNGSTARGVRTRSCSRATNVDGKKMTMKNRSSSTNTPPTLKFEIVEADPVETLLAKFSMKSRDALRKSKQRASFIQVASTIQRFGPGQAVSKDIAFYDPPVLKVVLEGFNRGKKWDIQLASEYLSPIIANLPDRTCGSACVQSLEIITSKLLANILTASRCRPSLGVDIAAEERKEQADACLKNLRELRDSKKVPVMKISEEVAVQLHDVLHRLRAI